MKVAVVVGKFPVVSETFVINHIVSLIKAGVEVRILTFENKLGQPLHPDYVNYNLNNITTQVLTVPYSKFKRFILFFKILFSVFLPSKNIRVLKTLNFFKFGIQSLNLDLFFKAQIIKNGSDFDVIHCHFGPVADDVQKLKSLGLISGKLIVSFHGIDFLNKQVLKTYKDYRSLFEKCDGVVANSTFTKCRLIKLGCKSNKIEIIPVIPSTVVFQGIINIKKKSDAFKVLTIARLVEKKGIKYALEAINILNTKYQIKVKYIIIGDGLLLEDLKLIVNKYGLNSQVEFLGSQSQDQIASQFLDSDVFLLPSIFDRDGDTETQGLVLIEAQLMSVPVISTKVGGICDSLKENVSGILADEKNPHQLADAIFKLYSDPALKKSMGIAGREFVMDKFNPSNITQKLISFYLNVMN